MPEYRVWRDLDGSGSSLVCNARNVLEVLGRIRHWPFIDGVSHEVTVRFNGETLAVVARDLSGRFTAEVLDSVLHPIDLPYAVRVIVHYSPNSLGQWVKVTPDVVASDE